MTAGPLDFFRRISRDFTWQFAASLVVISALLKGTVQNIWLTAALPYFKSIGVTGQMYQSLFTFTYLPWTLKAAMGAIVDVVPLFGFHKISYIVAVSVAGVASFLLLGFLPLSTGTAAIAAVLGFLVTLQVALVDLLAESKTAERMRAMPHTGANLISFLMGMYYVGTLAGSLVSGPIADHFDPRNIFFAVAPLAALPILPVALGWFPDPHVPRADRRLRTDLLRRHVNLMKVSLVMTVSAVVTGFSAIYMSPTNQALTFIVNAIVLNALAQALLPRVMARGSLYLFLSGFLQLNIQGASDYWFTADARCVPDGPHFSYTFYNTFGSILSSAAGAVTVGVFQKYCRASNLRHAFAVTAVLKISGALFDLIIFNRLNLKVGIPDGVAFLFGDAMMQMMMIQLELLPCAVFITKLCHAGVEGTVFALLASFINTGRAGARVAGVGLMEWAGIRTTVPCNFGNISLIVLLGRILLPLVAVPLIPVLIPDMKMTDDLRDEDIYESERQGL